MAVSGWTAMAYTLQPAPGSLLASQEAAQHANGYNNTISIWMLTSRQSSKGTTSQLKHLNEKSKTLLKWELRAQ